MSSQRQSLLCQYRYDPLDRLINQTRPETPTLQRFYCKSRLATEIQGAMQYSIVQHGDQLLAQQQCDVDDTSATLLATDLHRSVLQTLKTNHQRKPIAYSPYGHRSAESGLTSLLGFNGERPDPVTGHYLLGNGYRAFNPVLMRFDSPDGLSPFGKGGLNSYAYCLGDPVNSIDPTGHVALITKLPTVRPRTVSFPNQFNTHGTPLTLRPGISVARAERAFVYMGRLIESSVDQTTQFSTYLAELKTARLKANNRTNSNLQELAIKSIQSNSIPKDTLPPSQKEAATRLPQLNDRHKLLEYIETGRYGVYEGDTGTFSHTKLLNARRGEHHPSTPLHMRPTRESAEQYWHHIHSFRNPRRDILEAKFRNIRDIHFIV